MYLSGSHPLQADPAGEEGQIPKTWLSFSCSEPLRSDSCLVSLQVLFYVSPVSRLVGALMTVLSLFPGQKLFSLTLNIQETDRKSAD